MKNELFIEYMKRHYPNITSAYMEFKATEKAINIALNCVSNNPKAYGKNKLKIKKIKEESEE